MVKRILHFQGRMGLGGAESFMMNIYRHVNRQEMQFDFVIYDTYKQVRDYHNEIEKLGGRIFVLPNPKRRPLAYLRKLWQLLKREHFFAVENEVYFGGGINLWMAKQQGIKKRVAVSHATNDGKGKSVLHAWFLSALQKLLIHTATDLVAVSQEAGLSLFGSRPFMVVPNGIDFSKFKNQTTQRQIGRKKLKISNTATVAINIGRLEPQKNQAYLVEIVKSMSARQRANFVLLIVGAGSLHANLAQMIAQSHLSQNIKLLGNRNDVPQLLGLADIFLMPSIYEGLPTAGIEAQVVGLPSVFSNQVATEIQLSNQVTFLGTGLSDLNAWINQIHGAKTKPIWNPKILNFDSVSSSKLFLKIYQ